MSLDSGDWASIQYQNANNSVRVTDAFMEAADEDADWNLTARTDGAVVDTVKARELLPQIAEAPWKSADPGVQYDTTINKWHTLPNTGRINASNPCSEYMSIDDSACNLASPTPLPFRPEDRHVHRPHQPRPPVLEVHVHPRLGLQPRLAEPAQVPPRGRRARRRCLRARGRRRLPRAGARRRRLRVRGA